MKASRQLGVHLLQGDGDLLKGREVKGLLLVENKVWRRRKEAGRKMAVIFPGSLEEQPVR